MKSKKIIIVLMVISLVVLLFGCTFLNDPKKELKTITITPASVNLKAGETQEFTAVGKDGYQKVVSINPQWAITNDIGGINNTKGVKINFTATQLGTGKIVAKVGGITGIANITVSRQDPVLTTIEVAPDNQALIEGDQQIFTATGFGQYGDQMAITPQWAVTGEIGTVVPESQISTLFTATTIGTGTVVATLENISGSAEVTVLRQESVLTTIEVNPANPELVDGDQQEFTATGFDQYGDQMGITPEWTVTGNIGTVTPESGTSTTFTASSAGTGTVVATVGELTGSTNVTVSWQDSVLTTIEVSPVSDELIEGSQQEFAATGLDQYGDPIVITPEWTVTGNIGTVTPASGTSTIFTASTAGMGTVVAAVGDISGGAEVMVKEAAVVSGNVTDGRGGPALEGAVVSWNSETTLTNSDGYFELAIAVNEIADLLVEKEGRASTRVQDVQLGSGETLSLEIPNRRVFNPVDSITPPVITTNITPDQTLSGTVTVDVDISGDNNTYLLYPYLGGEQRYPVVGSLIVEQDTVSIDIDTTEYPNGDNYLRLLAYDENENAALLIIPVYIDNLADDILSPDDLSYLTVVASTFGQNIVLYGDKLGEIEQKKQSTLPDDPGFNLESAPAGATLCVNLDWDPVERADGYNIYRSFDGENYTKIGNVTAIYYDDFSPLLMVDQPIYYRVVPYNSHGAGNYLERVVIPLPALNVYLETPANMSDDVPLAPTFTWRLDKSGLFPSGISFFHDVTLFDATDYQIWGAQVNNQDYVEYPGVLDPGGIYSWDVSSSYGYVFYSSDGAGYSYAISYAGEYNAGTGSINGEYIFTTVNQD